MCRIKIIGLSLGSAPKQIRKELDKIEVEADPLFPEGKSIDFIPGEKEIPSYYVRTADLSAALFAKGRIGAAIYYERQQHREQYVQINRSVCSELA